MDINTLLVQDWVISVYELFIFYIACFNVFNKRANNKFFRYLIILASGILFLYLASNHTIYLALKYPLFAILISIMMTLLFTSDFKMPIVPVFLLIMLVYSLLFIVDYSLLFFIKSLNNTDIYYVIMGNNKNLFLISIISKTITLFIVLLFTKKISNQLRLTHKQLLMFIAILLLTIIALLLFIIPDKDSVFPKDYTVPSILVINALFMYYILMDFLRLSEKLRFKSVNEERFTKELDFWREMNKKDRIQRKMHHDYAETLLCIRAYLNEGKIEDLENFIAKLSVQYKLSSSFMKTENSLFDFLINSKYEQALACHINMICKLDNLKEIGIANEDFIFLMSNLIDNAIEHCETLQFKEKEIFLSIKNKKKYNKLEIIIRNPIEKNIIVTNALVKTTKRGSNHGLGLSNIKDIVQKYKGKNDIYVDDGYFTYVIVI